jgi:hypothetical protein
MIGNEKVQPIGLPYADNAKAILITIAINICLLFLFFWPDGATYSAVMADSLFCGVITTIISMCIVYPRLKKMRALGAMPTQVPESSFMQKLPKNPFLLGVVYAIAFAVLALGINAVVLWFFDLQSMKFVPWFFYKLIYSTILSIKIIEFCIFRYVQPDWTNTDSHVSAEAKEQLQCGSVKNPVLEISVFKEIFGSVTLNIAMNIIIGSVLGGVTVLADSSVIIFPTTIEAIPITGLVFGFIVGILVTSGVVTALNAVIIASGPGILEGAASDKKLTWMPKGKVMLTFLICICIMLFSAVALWGIMALFDMVIMNFYQFTIFITIYATIMSKLLSYLLVRRCMQSDYIEYTLKKAQILQ